MISRSSQLVRGKRVTASDETIDWEDPYARLAMEAIYRCFEAVIRSRRGAIKAGNGVESVGQRSRNGRQAVRWIMRDEHACNLTEQEKYEVRNRRTLLDMAGLDYDAVREAMARLTGEK